MRFIFILFILTCFSSCSFDNKSGIWINEKQISKKKENFDELETLITSNGYASGFTSWQAGGINAVNSVGREAIRFAKDGGANDKVFFRYILNAFLS